MLTHRRYDTGTPSSRGVGGQTPARHSLAGDRPLTRTTRALPVIKRRLHASTSVIPFFIVISEFGVDEFLNVIGSIANSPVAEPNKGQVLGVIGAPRR